MSLSCGMDPSRERQADREIREREPRPAPRRKRATPDEFARAQHSADRDLAWSAKRLDAECARLRAINGLARGSGARPKGLPTCAGCEALQGKIRAKDAMLWRRNEAIGRWELKWREISKAHRLTSDQLKTRTAALERERARAQTEHAARQAAEAEARELRKALQRATWRKDEAEAKLAQIEQAMKAKAVRG